MSSVTAMRTSVLAARTVLSCSQAVSLAGTEVTLLQQNTTSPPTKSLLGYCSELVAKGGQGLVPGHRLRYATASGRGQQSTNEVLMVAPTAFEYNSSAAVDNHFMTAVGEDEKSLVREAVVREHEGLRNMLKDQLGLKVHLFDHSEAHGTPDAVFPNNWFSTHGGGEVDKSTLVTYPMKSESRRRERREDILSYLRGLGGYEKELVMEESEGKGIFLEGTGALVLDRANKVAYAVISERCDRDLAEAWVKEVGYDRLVAFHSYDGEGQPVYHTNVVMAIGTSVAVVCTDSVTDAGERAFLLDNLRAHRAVVEISHDQMSRFCGNVLEVMNAKGLPCFVMSTQAYDAFTDDQKAVLRANLEGGVHHVPLDTIEKIGGGGVRCTIAEIF